MNNTDAAAIDKRGFVGVRVPVNCISLSLTRWIIQNICQNQQNV